MLIKDRGITLIALVITIIVLLILAGITIATLSGENGILQRATEARDRTKVTSEHESETLSGYESYIDEYIDGTVTPTPPSDEGDIMENPPTIQNVGTSSSLQNSVHYSALDSTNSAVNPIFTSNNSTLRADYGQGMTLGYNNIMAVNDWWPNEYDVEFTVDCKEFEIVARSAFRISVDDGDGYKYTSYDGVKDANTSALNYYKVQFSEKKKRNIKLELTGFFGGVALSNGDTISKCIRQGFAHIANIN